MALEPLTAALELGGKLIDKFIPDPEQKARAQLDLLRAHQQGELEEIGARLSAIIAEAKSSDPWTSRARPSFLYVVYCLLLFAIPMGLISAVSPETSGRIAAGMKGWLDSIPTSITDLFTFVMLGYVGARTVEKVKGAA